MVGVNGNSRTCPPLPLIRTADEIKWTEIAQDFGSYTRRAKGSILDVWGLWGNTVDEPKGKQFRSLYKICGP